MKTIKIFLLILLFFVVDVTLINATNSSGSVTVTVTDVTYTVTGTAGSGGTISPTSRTVTPGATTTFIVTPNTGYRSSASGCGGSLVGTTYTTGAINANCTVSATFTPILNPTGTLTATNCTIPVGGSTCNTNLVWNTVNPITTSAVTTPTNITVATGNSSTGRSYALSAGSRTFYLYNNGVMLAQATANATPTVVTVSVVASPTTYNTTPSANVSFTYVPTTNSGTTECRLLDFASLPLTLYKASSPITYNAPSTVGSYGYYVQCRNTTTTTAMATSAKITVNVNAILPATSGTITATGCTIPEGGSNCNTTLNWQTFNPVSTSTVRTGATVITTANTGTTTYAVPYNSRTFSLVHNGVTLGSATATATCGSNRHWDGATCIVDIPENEFTASPTTIFKGRSTNLVWNSPLADSCTGIGFSTVIDGQVKTNVGSVMVSPLVTTTYTLNCKNITGTTTESVIVKVINLEIKEN